nr:ribonuclease H-like domain-containing protein [Tanacetum cinerariifolium]
TRLHEMAMASFESQYIACAMSKSTKKTHKPKSKDTNQEKLYLLHMDLCGPMRVESVNEKKYVLVIVDDYSRFTWVKFLRSKDETPMFIIKFLKMIQNGVVDVGNKMHKAFPLLGESSHCQWRVSPLQEEWRSHCQEFALL